jgi:class 3 adenylate cyclase
MPRFKSREEYEKWKANKIERTASKFQKQNANKIFLYKTIMFASKALFFCTLVTIPIVLLPFVVSNIEGAASYPFIGSALGIEEFLTSFLRSIIPTEFFQIDWSPWIIILIAYFLSNWFINQSKRYHAKTAQLSVQAEFEAIKKTLHLSDNAKVLNPIKQKLESFASTSNDREELLKIFADTKKKLDKMGRDLSFLSVDIVDSTGMKEGEEKALVEHTFKEYKKFVEEKIEANGALKSAWTPDGVMICFSKVDEAVKAAREIIKGLDSFNKNVKAVKQDIKVRCGINSGYVYYDPSMSMEEMSDRIIDIAGHMQKYATPNNIFIAKPAIEPTNVREGFTPASKTIDGLEVYVWGEE